MPKLMDVMSALESADPRATIYAAAPFAPSSEAMVCAETYEGEGPTGLTYLLEVDVARDVLGVWASWRNSQLLTPEEAAKAAIYYAQHDAYEPVQRAGVTVAGLPAGHFRVQHGP